LHLRLWESSPTKRGKRRRNDERSHPWGEKGREGSKPFYPPAWGIACRKQGKETAHSIEGKIKGKGNTLTGEHHPFNSGTKRKALLQGNSRSLGESSVILLENGKKDRFFRGKKKTLTCNEEKCLTL